MKLFNNFQERLSIADDSTTSTVSLRKRDSTKASKLLMESSSDFMSDIFPDSQLPRLYKFESEDSGVELPSGANSPSTPTGSEQSFVVHSRESSCDSCNLKSDPTTLTDKLTTCAQTSVTEQAESSVDHITAQNTEDNAVQHSEELASSDVKEELHKHELVDRDQCKASGVNLEAREQISGETEEGHNVTEKIFKQRRQCGKQFTGAYDDMICDAFRSDPIRKSATSESLEEYMDQCCRLSESQQESSNPLGSGLGYLEHICQLLEKIGQLQETNLQLQRQICSLQKENRLTKTKEDFFLQHCSCGAASLAFQDVQKRHSRSEFLSSSGTLSDLSTIPEVTRNPLRSARKDICNESLTPIPLWRRGLNRRSYTEGEVHFLGDSTEGLSAPEHRLSENYTWGRVKDLMRKTRRNQSRLGLTSNSLKMSCPQLYMPDLGPVEPVCRQRNSMISLSHHSKFNFLWQQ